MSTPKTPHPAVVAISVLLAGVIAGHQAVVIAEHGVPVMTTISAGLAMFTVFFSVLYHFTRRTD